MQASEAAALQWDVPAIAVGLSAGGTAETAGIGCDPDARFRIASITKPFTALLSLDLLDLGATTGVWPDDVRVRHLLSHTSGFDCELTDGSQTRFEDEPDPLVAQLPSLRAVRRWLGTEQCWSYANSGYWLTAWLCAQAANTSYEDAVHDRLLRPLGLDATSFGEPQLPGTGRAATTGPYPRARRASGGLVSNVGDLLRFGERLLSEPRMRIVHGKPVAGVYGLGLDGQRVGGVEVWGHSGSYGGFESTLRIVPDRDAVLAGLTNSSLGGKALREIEDIFFERVLGARRPGRTTVELPEAALDELAGTYGNSDGWTTVAVSVDGLSVTIDDEEFDARAIGPRIFEITSGDRIHERFDFPLEGFGRFGSRLSERIA